MTESDREPIPAPSGEKVLMKLSKFLTRALRRCDNVTAFDDLSPYSYLTDSIPPGVSVLNVGWLDAGQVFPAGKAPAGFLEKLGILCACHAQAKMRGWHSCNLQHASGVPYPITIEVGDHSVALGGAEIRVVDRNDAC